jgi:hypothetical protein
MRQRLHLVIALGVFTIAGLYVGCLVLQEGFLIWNVRRTMEQQSGNLFRNAAKAAGLPADYRRPHEVILALRSDPQQKKQVYPSLYPFHFLDKEVELEWKGKKRIVFGSIPNSMAVLCAESGIYPLQSRDELGLPNPSGLAEAPIDILIVGDSAVEGACHPEGQRIADFIRAQHPETISVGMSSSGPLMYLAAMKEFIGTLRPKKVIWFYTENDVWDLNREKESALATPYLDLNYEPWQIAAWPKIQPKLVELSEQILVSAKNKREYTLWQRYLASHDVVRELLRFYPLRNFLAPFWKEPDSYALPPLFGEVIKEARRVAEKNRAVFHIVYLPAQPAVTKRRPHLMREQVIAEFARQKIPVTDLYPKFLGHESPSKLFPFGLDGHYSVEGQRLVADTVLEELRHLELKVDKLGGVPVANRNRK